jgi:hypothetical protein
MALIDKVDLRTGFWVGLGFALAFTVFAMVQMLLRRAAHRGG